MKSYTRRTHRKTRTGCVSCKRRKIKCGEEKPDCGNCIRHNITCDYAYVPLPPGGVTPESRSPASDAPGASGSLSPPSALDVGHGSALNLTDLELLHNFSTSTFTSLSQDPALRALWRTTVPQLGFANDFVMRGILAFSALHLANSCSSDRQPFYIACADAHHQAGLRQASALLPDVNAANCSALYIFTALSTLFAIARSRVSAYAHGSNLLLFGKAGEFPDWLLLFRGTRSVIDAQFSDLSAGILGPMIVAGLRRVQLRDEACAARANRSLSVAEEALAELRVYIRRTSPATDSSHHELVAYEEAIDELGRSFTAIYGASGLPASETEKADVFVWLFRITDKYLLLLQQHTQPSLVILAFFCTLTHRLEANWWMQGWSSLLMGRIWDLLDEEHRLLVCWPVEEIGWLHKP